MPLNMALETVKMVNFMLCTFYHSQKKKRITRKIKNKDVKKCNPKLFTVRFNSIIYFNKYIQNRDFPGGTVVKNPPANAGDTGSIPGPGRSHMPWSN